MGFKCGIVGLPNVGKSTLFNALTRAGIDAENFPFCTIEPNTGIVPVPDERLERIAALVKPRRVVPTTMEFVDIAGLVAGASRGEGLGNRFLAHIREMDAVAHVVRCFQDGNIAHRAQRISPREDVEIIDTELALADLETIERAYERHRRAANAGEKEAQAQLAVLGKLREALSRGEPIRALRLEEDEARRVRDYHLLTAKPVLFIANVAEDGFTENPLLEELRDVAAERGAGLVVISNKLEAELAELEPQARDELLRELGMEEPGLNRVIRAGYRLLGLRNFFTAGPKEVRAWTIRAGTRAPQAAGVIHSDFERGFIRAEVIAYADFVAHGGEQGAKNAGKWRLEGKEYIVQDGDVIQFRFNV